MRINIDCKRTCSWQTLSTTYGLMRLTLLVAAAAGLADCSAHRQIARSCHCAKTPVTRMAERVGRHAIRFHARSLKRLPPLTETVVTTTGRSSSGGRTERWGSARLWVPNPGLSRTSTPPRASGRRPARRPDLGVRSATKRSYIKSIRRTLHALIPHPFDKDRLVVTVGGRNDDHVAVGAKDLASRLTLRIYPDPKRGPKGAPRSPETIARDRAMWLVDHLHQRLRRSCADGKRGTFAFGRRFESIMGRAHLLGV